MSAEKIVLQFKNIVLTAQMISYYKVPFRMRTNKTVLKNIFVALQG